MNSVQTQTLSPAQNALWALPKADHPLSSWAEEAFTPDQFFRFATNKTVVWGGARQLLVAVLLDAVKALCRYRDDHTKRGRRLFKETLDWFRSADRQWLYSFENICTHLDVNADDLRRGLKRFSAPAVVPSAPFLRARGKGDRTPYLRTVRYGGNDGRNGQGVSLVGRTRRSAGA
jgi:hypothetical protein